MGIVNNKNIMNIVNFTNLFPWKFRKLIYEMAWIINKESTSDIRKGIYFDNINNVELGNNIYVGMNTNFICVTHMLGDTHQRAGENIYHNIEIGERTWIGANVLILLGVHIGEECVLATGSVVLSNCEKNCLYAGNPAVNKKRLSLI